MVRPFVIHVGTHKTGTTALQVALGEAAPELARHGFLIPLGGMREDAYVGAHHDAARGLLYDDVAPFEDLISALEESDAPAIASSECFSSLYAYPDRLAYAADRLRAVARTTTIVIYVREQTGYVESLYAELVHHGLAAGFDTFLDEIVEHGAASLDRWRYGFDYDRLADAFAVAFGERSLVVRAYESLHGTHAIFDDFCATVSSASDIPLDPPHVSVSVANERSSFLDVLQHVYDNRGAPGAIGPAQLIEQTAGSDIDFAERPFSALEAADAARIRTRFESSNRRLAERFGASPGAARSFPAHVAARRTLRAADERWPAES